MPQESPQREHIRRIRQEKFGLADDGTRLRENSLEQDLRNALQRLSQDLYSNVHHFILELIQNAEDNEYADGDAKLIFELRSDDPTDTPGSRGCLCVLNNETGFASHHVESICAVGQSTKSSQQGYIGEKGIGFKSVFVVCPRPHIFSKGYQFYFRKPDNEDPLGYIVPHWKEPPPGCVAQSNATTTLLLPLEANWREDIAKKLRVIEPESILFLKKLKGIRVAIPAEDFDQTTLKDENGKFVTLVAGGVEHPYFVSRKPFPRPADLIVKDRAGIEEREVTVAFPLSESTNCDGRVFAFLPTECRSGVPFLVNTDFLLSANRESIHFSYDWNKWLRNCIAPTFVEAFMDLLKDETHRLIAYKFIPLAEELQTQAREFFHPILEGIHTVLKQMPCVLTSRCGEFVLPSSAYLIGKAERELVELEDLPPLLQKISLVAPGLERWRDRLKPLGVQNFSTETLLRTINDKAWLERRNVEWFVKLFSRLQTTGVSAASLAHIPLLRCSDGVCRPPSHGTVYFRSGNNAAEISLPTSGPEIHFLDSAVATMLTGNPALSQWAHSAIGVRVFSLREYIVSSLLPWLAGQTENCSALVVGTQFIVANLSALDEAGLQAVRDKLPWLLDNRKIVARTEMGGRELVTPRCFEPSDGWPWMFVGDLDCRHFLVVADDYCLNLTDAQRLMWEKLFKTCNVTSIPDPQIVELGNTDQGYQQVFERCSRELPAGLPRLRECLSPRWLRQLEQPDSAEQKIKALVRLLNALVAFHRSSFDGFLRVKRQHIGQWHTLNCASEFSNALKLRAWLPTTAGYRKPTEAFWPSDEIKEFLQHTVPYVTGQLSRESAEVLGVHTSLTAPILISFLRELRSASQVNFEVVWRIYRRLAGTPGFDASVFQNEPLIYVPTNDRAWLKRDEVVWRDRKSVFDVMFGYLENDYDKLDLHGFFTSALGVAEEPGIKDFAQAWTRLIETPEAAAETVKRSLAIILPKLLDAHGELANAEWWPALRRNLKLWTNGAEFRPGEQTYLADDGIAAELFRDKVAFAWWPATSSDRSKAFLRDLGAKSLAEAVQIRIRYSNEQQIASKPQILTDDAKGLLVLLVCNQPGTDWTTNRPCLEAIVRSEEFSVSTIEAEYSLRNDPAVGNAPQKQDAHWNQEHRRLLLRKEAELEEMRSFAAASIARALFGGTQAKQMADTIFRFLTVGQETAKRIRRERNWQLTPEQGEWLDSVMPDNVISRETPRPEPLEPSTQISPASSREATQQARSNVATDSMSRTTEARPPASEEKTPAGSPSAIIPSPTERTTTSANQALTTDNPQTKTADAQSTQRTPQPRDENRQRRTRRVVTYVQSEEREASGGENAEARSAEAAERKRIGEVAEKFVVGWEKTKGREALRLGGNNEGYDIESLDPKTGRKRFIEVKGIDGSWEDDASVGMTAPQFEACRELGDDYWLYVVEYAMSETPLPPHCFKNPVASVTSYRFDKNWRQLLAAEE